jgi:hypothetical protein
MHIHKKTHLQTMRERGGKREREIERCVCSTIATGPCTCMMAIWGVQEHQLYPEAVAALVDGRVTWREDGVPILWTNK